MKKIIAWMTRGSKIVKVIEKIYKALVFSYSTLDGIETGFVTIDKEVPEKLEETNKYLSLCISALEKILEWFGISRFERASIANQNMNIETFKQELNALLDEDSTESKTALTFE